jgi:hypothetical protein
LRIYYPPAGSTDIFFYSSRNFRAHFPEISEVLEELFDRLAENCDLFVNVNEINKYSVTCTLCQRFDTGDCTSTDLKGPSIIKLLDVARVHDSLP